MASLFPEPNEALISTDKVEEAFERAAVPGFTGSVSVYVRLLPSAAHEVEFTSESRAVQNSAFKVEKGMPIVTNNRVNLVRAKMQELRSVFKLSIPIVCIKGDFVNGELRSFELLKVQR